MAKANPNQPKNVKLDADPVLGGSYVRDQQTGALTRTEGPVVDSPAPQATKADSSTEVK